MFCMRYLLLRYYEHNGFRYFNARSRLADNISLNVRNHYLFDIYQTVYVPFHLRQLNVCDLNERIEFQVGAYFCHYYVILSVFGYNKHT